MPMYFITKDLYTFSIKRAYAGLLLAVVALSAAWYFAYIHLLIFIAFVPLLAWLEAYRHKRISGLQLWVAHYIAFLLWNLLTTWWIWNASPGGMLAACFANALLMSLPICLVMSIARHARQFHVHLLWILAWLTFEYLHLNWELSWPWLQLGNAFAFTPIWIQWYEYTGTLGGTLWVLIVNVLIFRAFSSQLSHNRRLYALYAILLVVLPVIGSLWIHQRYTSPEQAIEVVVVQPNIDPYQEKFRDSPQFIPFEEQIKRFIQLSASQITPKTRLIVWPETAIDDALWESHIEAYSVIRQIRSFLDKNPQSRLITGLTSVQQYDSPRTATARFRPDLGYYDIFNTAMWLAPDTAAFYHKSKLVPMVEAMPYPQILGWLSDWVIDLGGTSGGYGKQQERSVFYDQEAIYAPIICFESVFGEYIGEYVNQGANLLCIITNDGWWGNTPGYRQHLRYASLRAIEHRRAIARCANTGISAFIDEKGHIQQATAYWTPAAIRTRLPLQNKITFYTRHGDYIGRLATFLLLFLWLSLYVNRHLQKSKASQKPFIRR